MAKYKVLHVSRYDFKNSEGEVIRGCKVTVLGDPFSDEKNKGCAILTFPAPYSLWDKFGAIPADYDLDLLPKQSGNKVSLFLKDACLK